MTNQVPLGIWRLSLKSLVEGAHRGGVHVIVVIADNETRARQLAAGSTNTTHGEEQCIEEYLDSSETDCVQIGYSFPATTEMVVAVDHDYDYDDVEYTWVE